MSSRLTTRIGMPSDEERAPGSRDLITFREPTVGALVRTKGSLFCLAQVSGQDAAVGRAARVALDDVQREYYYDLSAGVTLSLSRALKTANRRLYHDRRRLGLGRRGTISILALAVRGREAHVAKLGPASAVIVRAGRMYELPPPPAVAEEDPRLRQRRVAASLGEALEIEPYVWSGQVAADDRIALLSRNLAQVVGVDDLKRALATLRPSQAVEHLQHLFAIRGGRASDGILVLEVVEVPLTTRTHELEPVRPAEPLAGLPDQSPVPLADALGAFFHRLGQAMVELRTAAGRAVLMALSWVLAFVPRRRPQYPRSIGRTSEREEGRRRRLGLAGMVVAAALLAVGGSVWSLPAPSPTEAILRVSVAREAISEAYRLVGLVEERVEGADLVDRNPERASELLTDAFGAIEHAISAGVPAEQLDPLRGRVETRMDKLYRVTRIAEVATVADLASAFTDIEPREMVTATDGSLWILETGRGRVIRIEPGSWQTEVVYRAGQELSGGVAGEPWLIATAATDVVIVDRQRQAWRLDLEERLARRMPLNGIEQVSGASTLLSALQHRPPLLIFNLYLVDAASGEVHKWTPPAFLPVTYPDPPEPFLTDEPDLPPLDARDLAVDANLWLLHASTVTRVNFGLPLPQSEYSLDPPTDADLRPELDYRLLARATVGDREQFYVYDQANARILGFQRADGAYVRQWLAPRDGPDTQLLDSVLGLAVTSVADGPPAALLLTAEGVVRVVLD
jgi:hypothetical protein